MLSACSGRSIIGEPSSGIGMALDQTPLSNYKVVHSFSGSPDGRDPISVDNFSGSLYGETFEGGTNGYGSVFHSTTSGDEKVLYSFRGGNDGLEPEGGLAIIRNVFYGTTNSGGGASCDYGNGCGTVFALDASGKESIVYAFKSGNGDGRFPTGSLVVVGGTIYGTTLSSSAMGCENYGCGTVFGVTPGGKERIVYHFKGESDGCTPSGIIAVKGVLYGITGSSVCNGFGTIFSLTTSGKERALEAFQGGANGAYPNSLIAVSGVFYGTTLGGGNDGCQPGPSGINTCGVAFSLTTSGHEKVLYRFKGGADGGHPVTLTWLNGKFYGVTEEGGGKNGSGNGTIFSLTKSGDETILYRIKGSYTLSPGPLIAVSDALYGITRNGGGVPSSCGNYGCGTLYKFSP